MPRVDFYNSQTLIISQFTNIVCLKFSLKIETKKFYFGAILLKIGYILKINFVETLEKSFLRNLRRFGINIKLGKYIEIFSRFLSTFHSILLLLTSI